MYNDQIAIQITNRCNYSCAHCLRDHATRDDLDVQKFKDNLVTSIQHGVSNVALTGGEIILHKHLNEILDVTKELNVPYGFVTNGSFVDEYIETIKRYPHINALAVSLDGSTKETCDSIRCNGSYDTAINAIKKYTDLLGSISIYFMCCKLNYHEITSVIELARSLNVCDVWINGLVYKDHDDRTLTQCEREQAASKAVNAAKRSGVRIHFASCYLGMNKLAKCKFMVTPQISINPLNELMFCCNTLGRGAVIADLNTVEFKDALTTLKTETDLLLNARLTYGNDASISNCVFCQRYFDDKLKQYVKNVNC